MENYRKLWCAVGNYGKPRYIMAYCAIGLHGTSWYSIATEAWPENEVEADGSKSKLRALKKIRASFSEKDCL